MDESVNTSEESLNQPILTDKQRRFCEEYLIDLNASAAAVRAGYSQDSARNIGCENLTKPYIREYIEAELNKKALSAGETTKLLTDIAKSSLNDYFVIKQVEHTPFVYKPIAEVIKELEEVIDFEDEYASLANFSEAEMANHLSNQGARRRQIIRYQIELKRNPEATKKVHGETELIEVAELDMVKLVQDKEGGKIKSITPSREGLKVEMYPADAALRDLAKMHGLFEKDNKQKSDLRLSVDVSKEEAETILEALKDKI